MLHDVLEDTSLPLPEWVSPEAKELIEQMTHESWEEEQKIEGKEPIIHLLKLCDKLHTMYEETLRPDPTRRREWKELMQKLLESVNLHYPKCRVSTFAQAIIDDTDW